MRASNYRRLLGGAKQHPHRARLSSTQSVPMQAAQRFNEARRFSIESKRRDGLQGGRQSEVLPRRSAADPTWRACMSWLLVARLSPSGHHRAVSGRQRTTSDAAALTIFPWRAANAATRHDALRGSSRRRTGLERRHLRLHLHRPCPTCLSSSFTPSVAVLQGWNIGIELKWFRFRV